MNLNIGKIAGERNTPVARRELRDAVTNRSYGALSKTFRMVTRIEC